MHRRNGPGFQLHDPSRHALDEVRGGTNRRFESPVRQILFICCLRNYVGPNLTPDEQQNAVSLWDFRLANEYFDREATLKPWLDERQKIAPGKAPTIYPMRSIDNKSSWQQFCNCGPDAFSNAAKTLAARITKYGAQSDQVKQWVKAQDQVFSDCGRDPYVREGTPPQTMVLPESPTANMDALQKADRQYQIAAAYFYSMDWDTAREKFIEIAKDQTSPWHQLASYLAVRVLVRRASLDPDNINKDGLREAGKKIRELLAAEPNNPYTPDIKGLLGYVDAWTEKQNRLQEVIADLSKKVTRQDLDDYTRIFNMITTMAWDDQGVPGKYSDLSPALTKAEVSDWICTYQMTDPSAKEHALTKWHSTKSLAWLVAALSKTDHKDAGCAALMEAAAKVTPDSPAFLTVSNDVIRLLIQTGKTNEALSKLNQVLAGQNLGPSARNTFLAKRAALAHNLNEFMRDSACGIAGTSYSGGVEQVPDDVVKLEKAKDYPKLDPLLTVEAGQIMNIFMPLSVLKQAVQAPGLSKDLRRHLMFCAWVRAVVLDQEQSVKELSTMLKAQWPQIAADMTPVINASTPAERRFAASSVILQYRGCSPFITGGMSNDEDNMGCWWRQDEASADRSNKDLRPPSFLSAADLAAAKKEQTKLAAVPTAPDYITANVVAWAQTHPQDPKVPQTLYLAVHATKVGIRDDGTEALSKEAFQILHKKYPNNPWTKKTPYWY